MVMHIMTLVVLLNYLLVHDFHVSVIDIELNKENRLEIKAKIFYDDLQLALGLKPGSHLPSQYLGGEEMTVKYIRKKIKLSVNNKETNINLIKSKVSQPAVWLTFMTEPLKEDIAVLTIENNLLTEVYDDQQNIVNVKLYKDESFILNSKKRLAIYNTK